MSFIGIEQGIYTGKLGLAGRDQAKNDGYKYYVGFLCPKGHTPIRYTSNGQCRVCSHNNNKFNKKLSISKMIQIDHMLEQQAEDKFLDEYYSEDFV